MNRISRVMMVSVLMLAVGFFMVVPAAAEGEIAYVNLQEVFEAHPDKAEAEAQLNSEAQELQAELESEADDLSQEEQQQLLQQYQEELTQREQELIQEVLADIEGLLNQLAEEKGVSVVLDGQNVLYGGYDLTSELIEMIE
ncbi:MAG: OmpH family outer membrane protein [Bacillota bacterium]